MDFKCVLNVDILVRFFVELSKNMIEFLSCIRLKKRIWLCYDIKFMRGIINIWNNFLGINFRFNNLMYGGWFLRIKIMCNKKMVLEYIFLKVCGMIFLFIYLIVSSIYVCKFR